MTAFDQAWDVVKSLKNDPHTWVPGNLVVGNTGLPATYECSVCGAEKHCIQERNVDRVGQDLIDRWGPFYDNQGHVEKYGLALDDSVEIDGDKYHYTNATKAECDPDTLHDSPLMRRRRELEAYLNPPTLNPDDLPTILSIDYYDSPLHKFPENYAAFEAQTNHGTIKNDGTGGATYFIPSTEEGKKYVNVNEFHWDELIDLFEQKDMIGEDWEDYQ